MGNASVVPMFTTGLVLRRLFGRSLAEPRQLVLAQYKIFVSPKLGQATAASAG